MTKKSIAILLAALLALLFCLPVLAAPTQNELDGMTPYGLRAKAFPEEEGAVRLFFQVVGLGVGLPGMDESDDIYLCLEIKRGERDWQLYQSRSSATFLENNQIGDGEFTWRFDQVFADEEPIYFRIYCEYVQGGILLGGYTGTGLRSAYSNVAYIGIAGEGYTEPTTVGIAPVPYDEEDPPQESSGAMAILLALLLWIGVALALVLAIVVIIVIARKRKKNP
ncbi:MAG: hypothetical protein FWE98_04110 [Oscillospiraceae bacterium]|nr:hypothetical protein [Oscillospiraceae bacterium]